MKFFRFRRKVSAQVAKPSIPEGRRVYAIGDIHGRDDLFAQLLERIAEDNNRREVAEVTIILLGDLVDRGPSSRQVVERALALAREVPDVHCLMGNHEEVFLKALGGDPSLMRYFVRIGGAPTIHSYGLTGEAYEQLTFDELAEIFPPMVPAAHVAFLAASEDKIAIGDYLFVHAGIKPGVPLDAQQGSDLRWIREEFLSDDSDHGAVIVHGHTIFADVQELHNRIGIDTGAYNSGVLTALCLEGSERWYIATEPAAT
jgi:serine/threonine protein phosphatase 1